MRDVNSPEIGLPDDGGTTLAPAVSPPIDAAGDGGHTADAPAAPTTPSAPEPTNQATPEPTNQATPEPTDQATTEPTDQATTGPTDQVDNQRDRRSVDERREQLVDATIEVLAEEGLARATTRRITDQAGLALGAFHYAFRSKDELLEAVIERVAAGVEDVLHDTVARPAQDTTEAVTRIVTSFWEFIEESPDIQLAQYELTLHALREPALRRLAIRQYERYSEAVGCAIDRVPDPPTGQDRDDLARFVVATIDGLVLHSFVDDGDPEAAKRRLELYLSSLDNFLPDGDRVAS